MFFAEWVESQHNAFIVEVEKIPESTISGQIGYKVKSTVAMVNSTRTTEILFGVNKQRFLGKNDERIYDDLDSAIKYLIKRIFR